MKKQLILAVSATTLTFFSATMWADNLDNTNSNSTSPNTTYSRDRDRDRDDASFHRMHQKDLGDLRKANHLIGLTVKNDANENIGKVKDLALDLQNARIVSVIVATGGFAGVDRKLVAVPPSLFSYDENGKFLRTTLDKSRLQNAPEFRAEDWKNATQDAQVRETYQYYNVPTYYGAVAQPSGEYNNSNRTNDYTATSRNHVHPTQGNGAKNLAGQYNRNNNSTEANSDNYNNNTNNVATSDNRPTQGNGAQDISGNNGNVNNVNNVNNSAAAVENNNGNNAVMPKDTYPNSGYRNNNSVANNNHSYNQTTAYTNADGSVNWRTNSSDLSVAQSDAQSENKRGQSSTYYTFPSYDTAGTNDYNYYHSASYYDRQQPQNIGTVVRASKVIGSAAYDNQNQKLGKVETFVVDLHSGRIVEVILASGGFLGIDDQLSAVPPQSFTYDADNTRLTLNTTRDSLQSSPHFKNSEWETANQPERINEVYRTYHVEPYFTPANQDVDNTARNVRDRSNDRMTPMDQGNDKADIQTSAQIRKAVMAMSNLSTDAKNVKIITRDGHVTLRGIVNNEDEKREVSQAAARITSADNIDNQIEIKGATPISTDSTK